ncbi:hypothetical protein TCAL_08640 [Tigriopus californicus]|uniref:PPPDE domain-containing protein n=1 Tax=Tigriopus californicus TaxID=6832 RepID=A0A553NTD2_TIGCA|nr:hypothetical protein TCAL_08640 [Tigriopus californicus]
MTVMMEDGIKYSIDVNFYDLSQGMNPNGLWICGLVVYGKEYIFSKAGIESCRPGQTVLGPPDKTESVGETEISYSLFLDFVLTLADTTFRPQTFRFSEHNSISFTEAAAQFLCGTSIQKYLPSSLPDLSQIQRDLAQDLEQLFDSPSFVDASAKGGTIAFGNLAARGGDLVNYVPTTAPSRAESPDFDQLQAQIDACREESSKLRQRREAQLKDFEDQAPNQVQPQSEPEAKPSTKKKKLRSRSTDQLATSQRQRHSKSVERQKNNKPVERKPRKSKKRSSSVAPLPNDLEEESDQSSVPIQVSEDSNSIQQSENSGSLQRPKRVSFNDKPIEIIVEREEEEEFVTDQNGNPISLDSDEESLPPPLEEVPSENSTRVAATPQKLGARKKVRSPPPPKKRETVPSPLAHSASDVQNNNLVPISGPSSPTPFHETINNQTTEMAASEPNTIPTEEEGASPPKKNQKPSEPPVTFREFDHTADFEDLVREIVTMLDPEEQDRLREMEDWIIKNEGTWVLSEGFNVFLGRVLHDKSLPSAARVAMLRLLAFGAGMDDIVLIMHSDRKDHLLMNYAQEFDRHPIKEQEALALFFANLFENNSSSEWLLYISEWPSKGQDLSNIRVTTKVAVNALLGDTPTLQDYGTAIMHNLGTKEVFDDICSELAMAILQFFQGNPKEEHVFRCVKALNKFATIAHRDVPQLIKMIGPEPSKFSGMSSRVDEFIQALNARLARVPSF